MDAGLIDYTQLSNYITTLSIGDASNGDLVAKTHEMRFNMHYPSNPVDSYVETGVFYLEVLDPCTNAILIGTR